MTSGSNGTHRCKQCDTRISVRKQLCRSCKRSPKPNPRDLENFIPKKIRDPFRPRPSRRMNMEDDYITCRVSGCNIRIQKEKHSTSKAAPGGFFGAIIGGIVAGPAGAAVGGIAGAFSGSMAHQSPYCSKCRAKMAEKAWEDDEDI